MVSDTDSCRNTGDSNSIPYKWSDDEMNAYGKALSREELSCPSTANISSSSGLRVKKKSRLNEGCK